jgi:prepilin-type N-terminal cleavage/methylation domain-containing protein
MKQKGFTLIELLVVISIIGLLASVVLVSLSSARAKSRDAKRRSDAKQISTALELYYNDYNQYPSPTTAGWHGMCTDWNTGCNGGGAGSCAVTGTSGYIPNLAPTYVSQLPRDPKELGPGGCYIYKSDGKDYMFLVYGTVENCANISSDPMVRSKFPNECNYAVYSSGGSGW